MQAPMSLARRCGQTAHLSQGQSSRQALVRAPSQYLPRGRRLLPRRVCCSAAAPAGGAAQAQGVGVAIGAGMAPADVATEVTLPAATLQKVIGLGMGKAAMPIHKTLILALLAGFYVSWGAVLMLQCGANCPGLATTNPGLQKLVSGCFGLPFGLAISMIAGAELFTGNTSIMSSAAFSGRISWGAVLRNWSLAYIGNLTGCIILASALVFAGSTPPAAAVTKIAVAKTSLPVGQAIVRGILANWLVNVGVWMATASTSVIGKIAAAVVPVLIFVSCGLEHSVANMFFIPLGILMGGDVTWSQFFVKNLLPVTFGNILGGAGLVGATYSIVYGHAREGVHTAEELATGAIATA